MLNRSAAGAPPSADTIHRGSLAPGAESSELLIREQPSQQGNLRREDWSRLSRFVYWLTIGLLVGLGPWIIYRSGRPHGSDFSGFMDAGRYVLEHGDRDPQSNLFRYLPSVDAAFSPLTLLPIRVSGSLWYALNIICWFGLIRTVRKDLLRDVTLPRSLDLAMLAALLGLPIALDGFLLSSFHIPMLWLMVLGLLRVRDGRPLSGGLLLGAAVWLKLLPLVGVGYLILKRRFVPAAVALATVAIIDVSISLSAYGWAQSQVVHAAWLWQDAVGTTSRQLDDELGIDEDRITNQSLTMLLRRATNPKSPVPELVLYRLTRPQVQRVFAVLHIALGLGLFLLLRRSGNRLTHDEWSAEIAIMCLCTIWLSPVVWSYHFTAVIPALAMLLSRTRTPVQHWIILGIWSVGLSLFLWDLGRAAGHMFWATSIVGAWLAWTMCRPQTASASATSSLGPVVDGNAIGGAASQAA